MLQRALILAAAFLLAACSGPLKVVEGQCGPKPPEERACRQQPVQARKLADGAVPVRVDARCHFTHTGVQLQPGERYTVTVVGDPVEAWDDWIEKSHPATGWVEHPGLYERFVRLFSRAPDVPMYALVGAEGEDRASYFPALAGTKTATRAGELLLFPNDWYLNYGNNKGCLDVEVKAAP